MNYLLSERIGAAKNDAWLAYFDAVVTGCAKPSYFVEHKPLFEVPAPPSHHFLYQVVGWSVFLVYIGKK